MESVRESWTDERLDELSRRVDGGFTELRGEFAELRGEIRWGQRAMVFGFISMTTAILAGFGGMIALLAAQA